MGYETVNQCLQFKYLIDENTLGKMVEVKLFKLLGWFSTIGTFVSGLMLILFFINVILTLVDTGISLGLFDYFFYHSIINFTFYRLFRLIKN